MMRSPWSSIRSNSMRFYGRHLEPDEEVVADASAIYGEAGVLIATGLLVGFLCGALAWTIVDTAALLPLGVLGAFAGIIGGVVVAGRRARSTAGPGATLVRLVMTDRRLLMLRQRPAARIAPLRSHRREAISRIESRPTRVGAYRATTIELGDKGATELLVAGPRDFAELWQTQERTPEDRAASEEEPTG